MKSIFGSLNSQKISPRKVKAHAKRIFHFLFKSRYAGEVFLCGGAFQPLVDPQLKINRIDLWVRNRFECERLVAALVADGAQVVHDAASHGIRLQKDGTPIEVNDDFVSDGGAADIVRGFDLANSAVGVEYDGGQITEVAISKRLKESLARKRVLLEDGYLPSLREQHPPCLLRGIDRMRQFASDAGFEIDPQTDDELWEVFESEYSPEEKQQSLDHYMETMVTDRSHCDREVLKRATDLVLGA